MIRHSTYSWYPYSIYCTCCEPHLLHGFDEAEAEDPDLVDYFLVDKTAPIFYDVAQDQDQQELEREEIPNVASDSTDPSDEDLDLSDEEQELAQGSAVQRVCLFFLHPINQPLTRI